MNIFNYNLSSFVSLKNTSDQLLYNKKNHNIYSYISYRVLINRIIKFDINAE